MNLSPYEIAIIAGGFTIIGALLGGWIGYRNAIMMNTIVEFNKAAAEFRAAFINEQRLLDPNSLADRASAGSASIIIKNAIDKHEVAMIKFEPFICKNMIEEYNQAWQEYAGNDPRFERYSGNSPEKQEAGRSLALSNIKELLMFAKPKY